MRIHKTLYAFNCKKLLTWNVIFILLCIQILGTNAHISISTEILPDIIQENESTEYFDGYNLFVLAHRNKTTNEFINRTLLITDLKGNIYFERELSVAITLDYSTVEFVNSTTILYGDFLGARLWNLETNVTKNLYLLGHHDLEKDYLSDTYYTFARTPVTIDSITYNYDLIREYNSDGLLLRSINTRDFVETWQVCPYGDMIADTVDITHANSLFFDEDENVMYLNIRNVNTFYKLNHHTGDVIWSLGEYGDFTMHDLYGNQRDSLFYHAHSLEKIDDNKFLIFDNDYHNQTDAGNHRSRLVEITVDEDNMQANVTWEWIAKEDYFSFVWGDCDKLPNNNYLGVFGYTSRPGTDLGARLVEVNPAGDIVWELSFPRKDNDVYGVYSMERFRFAPTTSAPVFFDLGNDSYFEWDVWYNFRSKTNYTGEYYITIDDQLVDTNSIVFPKYWKSTKVRYYIDDVTAGQHEISLVVADEAGHLSNESNFYESIGSLVFNITNKLEIILGISLGVGVPIFIGSVLGWLKFVKKKSLFKSSGS